MGDGVGLSKKKHTGAAENARHRALGRIDEYDGYVRDYVQERLNCQRMLKAATEAVDKYSSFSACVNRPTFAPLRPSPCLPFIFLRNPDISRGTTPQTRRRLAFTFTR